MRVILFGALLAIGTVLTAGEKEKAMPVQAKLSNNPCHLAQKRVVKNTNTGANSIIFHTRH